MPKDNKLSAIYALQDADGVVRYVGKAIDPDKRLAEHARADTIRTGCRPTLVILEWTDDWETAERRWIAHYRGIGAPLVNVADGGMDMAHVRTDSEKYPAYAWLVRFYSRRGAPKLAAGLRKKAKALRREHGAEGMQGFNAHIRSLLREMLPLSRGAQT